MRPLHLLGLMPHDYRFHSPDHSPLMVPGSIPPGDHELIIAFFQQVITERPLPRIEVDWYTMLLDPSRRYLEHVLDERGSSGVLVVVKVRQIGVDLEAVAREPAIMAFEHVAISNVHPGGTEDLRALLALTHHVRAHARVLYEEIAERLRLNVDSWSLITALIRTLQNPIDVLETVNALIEVQLEQNPPEEHRNQILKRMLTRLLEWRPAGELAALIGLATRNLYATKELLQDDAIATLEGLSAQGVLRDGELRQWAVFLREVPLWQGLFGHESRLPTEAQMTEAWAGRVRRAMYWTGLGETSTGRPTKFEEIPDRYDYAFDAVKIAYECIHKGKLARAREIVSAFEGRFQIDTLPASIIIMYWISRGVLESKEGEPDLGELSLREALHIAEEANAPAYILLLVRQHLVDLLRSMNKADEALIVLREAVRLGETLGPEDPVRLGMARYLKETEEEFGRKEV